MKDGTDSEVGFEVFEGFFDGDELDVVLPQGSRVAFGEIGAQQIAALRGGGVWRSLLRLRVKVKAAEALSTLTSTRAPSDRGLGAGGAEGFISSCSRLFFICGPVFEAPPQPFQLSPAHRAFFQNAVGAFGEDVELAVLGQQFDVHALAPLAARACREATAFPAGSGVPWGCRPGSAPAGHALPASRPAPARSGCRDPSPRRAGLCPYRPLDLAEKLPQRLVILGVASEDLRRPAAGLPPA